MAVNQAAAPGALHSNPNQPGNQRSRGGGNEEVSKCTRVNRELVRVLQVRQCVVPRKCEHKRMPRTVCMKRVICLEERKGRRLHGVCVLGEKGKSLALLN